MKRRDAGETRRGLIAAIHARAKNLGLREDERRDVQRRVTGKASCRDMTLRELGAVADDLRRTGRPAGPVDAGRPAERLEGMRRRARALAAEFGAGEAYLDAVARRQSGGTAFADLGADGLRGVVAAMWKRAKRLREKREREDGQRAVG